MLRVIILLLCANIIYEQRLRTEVIRRVIKQVVLSDDIIYNETYYILKYIISYSYYYMVVEIVGCIIIITLCKSNELFFFFFFLRLDDIVRRELCVLNIYPPLPSAIFQNVSFCKQASAELTITIIDNYTSTHRLIQHTIVQ